MSARIGLITTALLLPMSTIPAFAQPPSAQSQAAERQRLQDQTPDTPGTGRYPAIKEIEPGLPGHVVYRPADLGALGDTKLGIYVFGNGACSDDGASARLHLLEIASHGYLAIAPGAIYNGPGKSERPQRAAAASSGTPLAATRAEQLVEAIDWALAEHARDGSPYFGRIDADAIAVSGFSCGGLQALAVAHDPRIATAVIMNSGVLNDGPTRMGGVEATKAVLDDLHTPTLYILGGLSDIAYANGVDDFARIDHVPAALASIDKGHGGTYWEPNGGAAAEIVVDWLAWHLRGDSAASRTFLGEDCALCVDPSWSFATKGFESLQSAGTRSTSAAERGLQSGQTFKDCRHCPDMIVLPPGVFTMGSPPDEPLRRDNEPQQQITIRRAFAMSKTPVTWNQWEACVRAGACDGVAVETALATLPNGEPNPDYRDWGRGTRPVVGVSWYDAQSFVGWLNAKSGDDDAYRLPSEAEWEYAARAGTTTPFPWGTQIDHDHGNFGTHVQGQLGGQAEGRDVWVGETSPVGSFAPNAFGLYDMHGNVFEWTEDCYEADRAHAPSDGSASTEGNCANRVFRSGTFLSNPYMQRSARRGAPYPATLRGRNYLGFRVAKTLD